MKHTLCLPCSLEMKRTGKYNVQRTGCGKNQKITCWWCSRRRYGAEYEVTRRIPRDAKGVKAL